jgi:predicted kinase
MSHVHLIIGPVGAGKSTFGLKLSRELGAVRLTLDDWMATLYGDDERPAEGRIQWYLERTERCLNLIWELTRRMIDVGTQVVLEVGLIQREPRQSFYARIDAEAYAYTIYVVDADRDVRRQRVLTRNQQQGETFSVEVPLEFFEFASDLWEPPTEDETIGRNLRYIAT